MSKKFRVIMAVLAAVVILSTLGVASVAMADEPEDANLPPGMQSLIARVAGILGVTEQELTDAFRQAREDMRAEWQASNNCTFTENRTCVGPRMDRLQERMQERQDNWAERNQQWQEKKHCLMDRWQHRWQDDDNAAQTSVILSDTGSDIAPSGVVY